MAAGNTERIHAELTKAVQDLPEKFAGYREGLVRAALDCITVTAEHDDRRQNINQRFNGHIEQLAKQAIANKEGQAS